MIWVFQPVKRFQRDIWERFMRSKASWKGQINRGWMFFLLKTEVRTSNEIIKRLVQNEQKRIHFHKTVNKAVKLFTMGCTGY